MEKLRKLKKAHKAKRLLEEAPIKGLKFCFNSYEKKSETSVMYVVHQRFTRMEFSSVLEQISF